MADSSCSHREPLTRSQWLVRGAAITALLVSSSVPLVVQYQFPPESPDWTLVAWIAAVPGLWLVWSIFTAFLNRRSAASRNEADRCSPVVAAEPFRFRRELLVAGLLGVLTYVAIYTPMWRSYWRGADDAGLFWCGEINPIWEVGFDRAAGRPMQMSSLPALSRALKPGYRDGYLWVTGAIWFFCSWLLYLILRRVLPENRFVAIAAAVLLLTNSAEPSRFFVFSTGQTYTSSLCVLMLSFWMLLVSVERRSTGWLMAACVTLGATLLSNEGQYPLALMGFVLIGATYRDLRTGMLAAYAWFGTLLLLSVRFISFLVLAGKQSYQLRQATGGKLTAGGILTNARRQLLAVKEYFSLDDLLAYRHYAAAALVAMCVLALVLVGRASESRSPDRRRLRWMFVWTGAAILFGVAPFLHIPIIFRTQFFAIPGQAVAVALMLALLTTRLPVRSASTIATGVLTLLAANGVLSSHRLQDSELQSPSFDRLAHVFQQVHSLAPELKRDQLVLLIPASPAANPLGDNHALVMMSGHLLQTTVVQWAKPVRDHQDILLQADKVTVSGHAARVANGIRQRRDVLVPCTYRYQDVIAFQMSSDGNLQLLEEIPPQCCREGEPAGYAPRNLVSHSSPESVRFCQYESNVILPADVLPRSRGFILDGDWSPLCQEGEEVYRSGSEVSDIYVSSHGQPARELSLRVAAGPALEGKSIACRAVTAADVTLATFQLGAPQDLTLRVPFDGVPVESIRFVPESPELRKSVVNKAFVRLLTQEAITDPLQVKMLASGGPDGIVAPEDINDYTVELGANWLPLITHHGPRFRWVGGGAEVLLPKSELDYGELSLEVEVGPSYGPGPLVLKLTDPDGQVISTASVKSRGLARFALNDRKSSHRLLRLECDSQHLEIEGDKRELNFRAFSVRYVPMDAQAYEFAQARNNAPPTQAGDVHDGSVILADNWFPAANSKQGRFRWMSNEAEVTIQSSSEHMTNLSLDAEIGPSCGQAPGQIRVLNSQDEEVAAFRLGTRKTFTLNLPATNNALETYRICVDSQEKPVPGDPRILNLRVFSITSQRGPSAPAVRTASFEDDQPVKAKTETKDQSETR